MRQIIISSALLLVVCPLSFAVDETAEPPLKYSMKIGDKTVAVSEGQSIKLQGTFTDPEIKLTAEPNRVFPYQGISFNYPRTFNFEADLSDPDARNWTMSGNHITIMYFILSGAVTTTEFANNMIEQFGSENAKITNANASIELGKHKLNGTTLRISIAAHQMAMDIFLVPGDGNKTKLLVFQDNLDESGNRSKEGKRTMAGIKSSFSIKR